MAIPISWVDAFSDRPFAGNPAGVCVMDEPLPEARMQSIAFELGIAETAFVVRTDEPTTFGLRWFSPQVEIPLCGHATLASAHVLRQDAVVDGSAPLTFTTMSGPLHASFSDDGLIALDFPADPVTAAPLPDELVKEWDAEQLVHTGHTPFFTFVALRAAAAVADYVPDLGAIGAVERNALLLTAPGDPGSGVDYVLRVFGPNVGIAEDPATGSAQCAAGPYWAAALGRAVLEVRQLSARGASMRVTPQGERCVIEGAATTVLTGHLC
jgi:PhzF family phenazine biosynthesis protein